MPEAHSYDYTVVRVVPRVERQEFVNAGVILLCRTLRFLDCRIALDRERLRAIHPDCDAEMIQAQLDLIPPICAGGAAAGTLGELDRAERFRWLAATRSTVVQAAPIHSGLCTDPASTLDDLFVRFVA